MDQYSSSPERVRAQLAPPPYSSVPYAGNIRASTSAAPYAALPYGSTLCERVPYEISPSSAALGGGLADPYVTGSGVQFASAQARHRPQRPLRVAHVGSFMMRGGIEMWLKGLIRHTDPARLRFVRSVVTSPEYFDASVAAELGIPVEIGGAESVRRIAQDCDVLLCSGPAELGEWLADRPALAVFVAHGDAPPYRSLLERCAPAIDHVVAVSAGVQNGICHDFPCTVIPNGIDLAHIAPRRARDEVRQSLGFSPQDFVLGYVGRFSWEKRPGVVIDAVAKLPPRFKALLVGWGADRPALLDQANDRIPGRYAFADGSRFVGDFYQAMDAFCLPSEWEGFGLVVLEAMFSSVPVIANNVGCVPDAICDRVSGLVVDGRPDAFAQAASLLAAHPDWARGLALEGRRYAELHGHAATMCRQYEELLTQLWSLRAGEIAS